jgi:hypothetical protein
MADTIRHEDHWLFTDADNRIWKVYKQSIPKKRGYFTRWYGDSGNLSVAGEKTKSEVVASIKEKYGMYTKPKRQKKNNLSKYLVH